MKVLCLLALTSAAVLGAQPVETAAGVVELVFHSLYSDHDDSRLAQELSRLKLSDCLSPKVSAYFRYLGLGPLSLDAMQRLQHTTAGLPCSELPVAISYKTPKK